MKTLRALLAGLFCLWLVAVPSVAMLTVNQLDGFNVGEAPAGALPSISFIGCTVSVTDATQYTFSSHSVGTEGNRHTIVGVGGEDSASTFGVASVSVGGDAAAEVIDQNGSGIADAAIYILSNPVGTTEDIVVNFSEAVVGAAVCVWDAKDLSSDTAVSTQTDADTGTNSLVLDHTSSANGVSVGIAFSSDNNNARSFSWTGVLVEDTEFDGTSESNGAAATFTEDATAGAVSASVTFSAGTNAHAAAAAHFR